MAKKIVHFPLIFFLSFSFMIHLSIIYLYHLVFENKQSSVHLISLQALSAQTLSTMFITEQAKLSHKNFEKELSEKEKVTVPSTASDITDTTQKKHFSHRLIEKSVQSESWHVDSNASETTLLNQRSDKQVTIISTSTIGNIAVSSPPKPKPNEHDGKNIQKILHFIRYKIEKSARKHYPVYAQRKKIEGKVLLRFSINTDGNILHSEILEHSGHAILDASALLALKSAVPFPYVPQDIEVPIEFTVLTEQESE